MTRLTQYGVLTRDAWTLLWFGWAASPEAAYEEARLRAKNPHPMVAGLKSRIPNGPPRIDQGRRLPHTLPALL